MNSLTQPLEIPTDVFFEITWSNTTPGKFIDIYEKYPELEVLIPPLILNTITEHDLDDIEDDIKYTISGSVLFDEETNRPVEDFTLDIVLMNRSSLQEYWRGDLAVKISYHDGKLDGETEFTSYRNGL